MYCTKGHKLTEVSNTLITDDCYVCLECKEIYELKYVKVEKFELKADILKFTEILKAREKVSTEDLIKLGYLKEPNKVECITQ